jgi:hypothetical protein
MTTSTSARFREWFVGVSVLAMLAALVVALPAGASSFSTEVINGSNGFDTGQEAFSTSTVADSGYTSYAVWDREDLYLGYTGSNVGQGDNDANPKEEGQGPEKYIVYYLDTDPYGDQGTTDAEEAGGQDWELPMQADYEILIRTDGETTADGGYTGVADVREWTGTEWSSIGDEPLHIWDNNGSNYIEFSVDLSQLDSPENVSVVSWFYDTEQDISYGYWPATTAEDGTANGTRLQDYYGFPLIDRQIPNASDEQANLNREWFGDQEYCFSDTFGSGPAEFAGTGDPFHSAKINGGNGFNSQDESFETSTVADTGYTSYATWDREKLFLGYTGPRPRGRQGERPEPATLDQLLLRRRPDHQQRDHDRLHVGGDHRLAELHAALPRRLRGVHPHRRPDGGHQRRGRPHRRAGHARVGRGVRLVGVGRTVRHPDLRQQHLRVP